MLPESVPQPLPSKVVAIAAAGKVAESEGASVAEIEAAMVIEGSTDAHGIGTRATVGEAAVDVTVPNTFPPGQW